MPNLLNIYGAAISIKFGRSILDLIIEDLGQTKPSEINNEEHQEKKKIDFNKQIDLSKIKFRYKGTDQDVIDNLNLTINSKETIGIVGASGAGKSTIIDIILGLLRPSKGEIRIDGVRLDKTNLTSWRGLVGYVPQSIFLLDDTISNNIAFGIPEEELSQQNILRALELSKLDDFVNTLPNKLNTLVGERGVRLSGGQKQRIAIARALYSDPDVLILDEATSSIDGNTEKSIVDSINNLMKMKTIIIVAHRMNTVSKCDQIYLLENGRIIESGSYNYLSNNSLKFKELAQLSKKD